MKTRRVTNEACGFVALPCDVTSRRSDATSTSWGEFGNCLPDYSSPRASASPGGGIRTSQRFLTALEISVTRWCTYPRGYALMPKRIHRRIVLRRDKFIAGYNLMGFAKSALDQPAYLANALGPRTFVSRDQRWSIQLCPLAASRFSTMLSTRRRARFDATSKHAKFAAAVFLCSQMSSAITGEVLRHWATAYGD